MTSLPIPTLPAPTLSPAARAQCAALVATLTAALGCGPDLAPDPDDATGTDTGDTGDALEQTGDACCRCGEWCVPYHAADCHARGGELVPDACEIYDLPAGDYYCEVRDCE